MTLHIVQLGPVPPPEGGISRNLFAIRDELITAGHKCSVIATARSERAVENDDIYHPRTAFSLLRLLSSLKADVVHMHIGGDVSIRVLALAFACTLFGPSVLTMHSGGYPDTENGRSAKRMSLRGMVFRRFDRVIVVNERLADVFRRYGVENERISLIPPFVLKRPDPGVKIPENISTFIERHSPILLAVGGLEPDYDPLFQIDAMREIRAEFPDAGLMIVGGGSLRQDAERAIDKSGRSEHIHLTGNIDHAVTLRLIEQADVVLRTTLFDGDAISVREALFLGTPVIATDNGMRPEGVLLVKEKDVKGLIAAIRKAPERPPIATGDDGSSNVCRVIALYDRMAGSL